MKALLGTLILVTALFFVGCATQTGSDSTSSVQSTSNSVVGGSEGGTGPDALDNEIVLGHH
jgi:hypothetical protein